MIFILAFLGITFGIYFMQRERIKREQQHEKMQGKFEDLLEKLRTKKDTNTTADD